MSPNLLNGNWTRNSIYDAIKRFQTYGQNVIFMTLKEIPESNNQEIKNSQGETLTSLLHNVQMIPWITRKDEFWLKLRLKLPPKRNILPYNLDNINLKHVDNSRRLTSNSNECLDQFV